MAGVSQTNLKIIAQDCVDKISGEKAEGEFFNEPFKHLVIDNFLPAELADQCLDSFPSVADGEWDQSNDEDIEVKYRSRWQSEFDIPENIVDVVRLMNSAPFLRAMGEKFGIPKIVPDPYFAGGGLNVSVKGGLLGAHVDGNYHDPTGLNRRLNALIYLNPEWKPEWGGAFGIYDSEGQECVKKIAPLHNRLIIFDTHDYSFHGFPEAINFPDEHPRRSIILYYYTKAARPESQTIVDKPHSALWVKRGLKDKRGNTSRQFT